MKLDWGSRLKAFFHCTVLLAGMLLATGCMWSSFSKLHTYYSDCLKVEHSVWSCVWEADLKYGLEN